MSLTTKVSIYQKNKNVNTKFKKSKSFIKYPLASLTRQYCTIIIEVDEMVDTIFKRT